MKRVRVAQSLTTLIDVKFELEDPYTDLRQAPDPPTVRDACPCLAGYAHSHAQCSHALWLDRLLQLGCQATSRVVFGIAGHAWSH